MRPLDTPALVLLGATGRLGRPLFAAATQRALVTAAGRDDIDLASATPDALGCYLDAVRPDAVLNSAAMARVDACETDREAALAVNATGPGHLAEACAAAGIPLVHVSTDYVFGDREGPFSEAASTGPVQWYGETKRRGEEAVLEHGGVVARVSWLFGPTATAFADHVLGQIGAGAREVRVFGWQRSRPTYAPALAHWLVELTALLARAETCPPILHPGGGPSASRAEWARVLLDAHGHRDLDVIDQPRRPEEAGRARRPDDSRLDGAATAAWSSSVGLPALGDWRLHLRAVALGASPGV